MFFNILCLFSFSIIEAVFILYSNLVFVILSLSSSMSQGSQASFLLMTLEVSDLNLYRDCRGNEDKIV